MMIWRLSHNATKKESMLQLLYCINNGLVVAQGQKSNLWCLVLSSYYHINWVDQTEMMSYSRYGVIST